MIVQYMSDLHLEFGKMEIPIAAGDVLVLAGDIHLGTNAIPWIEECSKKFDDVIYILGNHEYYRHKFWKLPDQIRNGLSGYSMEDPTKPEEEPTRLFDPLTNVHFLNNESIKIGDVNFHGTTFWSKPNPMVEYSLNDFKLIEYKYKGGHGKFSSSECTKLHFKAKWWLNSAIVKGEKNVVITHFAPSVEMTDRERYSSDMLNSYYCTDVLDEFDKEHGKDISLWISGHTHSAYDKVIHNIHSVSNCRGYIPYEPTEDFNPLATIEV
jgi:predicted phosphodiesterase